MPIDAILESWPSTVVAIGVLLAGWVLGGGTLLRLVAGWAGPIRLDLSRSCAIAALGGASWFALNAALAAALRMIGDTQVRSATGWIVYFLACAALAVATHAIAVRWLALGPDRAILACARATVVAAVYVGVVSAIFLAGVTAQLALKGGFARLFA